MSISVDSADMAVRPLSPLTGLLRTLGLLGGFPLVPSQQSPDWETVRTFDTSGWKRAWSLIASTLYVILPIIVFLVMAYPSGFDGFSYFIPQIDRQVR